MADTWVIISKSISLIVMSLEACHTLPGLFASWLHSSSPLTLLVQIKLVFPRGGCSEGINSCSVHFMMYKSLESYVKSADRCEEN